MAVRSFLHALEPCLDVLFVLRELVECLQVHFLDVELGLDFFGIDNLLLALLDDGLECLGISRALKYGVEALLELGALAQWPARVLLMAKDHVVEHGPGDAQQARTGVTMVLLRVKRKRNGFTMVFLRVKRKSIGFTMVLFRFQRKSTGV